MNENNFFSLLLASQLCLFGAQFSLSLLPSSLLFLQQSPEMKFILCATTPLSFLLLFFLPSTPLRSLLRLNRILPFARRGADAPLFPLHTGLDVVPLSIASITVRTFQPRRVHTNMHLFPCAHTIPHFYFMQVFKQTI